MAMKLREKSDSHLIADLKNLVARERQTLTQILDHLREVDTRRLYLARGFPSLFAWMRSELGYSEASAQRRIAAMRLIKEVPEVQEDLKAGEMSLSVISQVQSYFRRENQKRREKREMPLPKAEKLKLLSQLKGSSSRECERKLIQLSPELNLPKEKTRPVSTTRSLIQFTAEKSLLAKIERLKDLTSHQNPSGSYEKLFEQAVDLALERLDPLCCEARRKLRQIKGRDKVKNMEIQGRTMLRHDTGEGQASILVGKVESNAKANANSGADIGTELPASEVGAKSDITARLSEMKIKGTQSSGWEVQAVGSQDSGSDHQPASRSEGMAPTAPVKAKGANQTRHIPRRLRDQIWQRDQGRCQHRDPKTGKICGSSRFLQLDHQLPFALGGKHQEQNLRLLCRGHNQYRSELLFGRPRSGNSRAGIRNT